MANQLYIAPRYGARGGGNPKPEIRRPKEGSLIPLIAASLPRSFFAMATTVLFALSLPSQAIADPATEIPSAKFTDVTASAGIHFIHNNGAYGEKLLPETMGGGVAFLDYDNDGFQDLLLINSTYWPGHVPPGKQPTTLALY